MKKAIIAGAASAVLAAMPVLGAFAADVTTQTDMIVVTIDPVCTIKADSVTHAAGTSNVGTWSGDTLSGKMTNGSNSDNYGATSMTIVCNDHDGWEVTAKTANLTGAATTGAETIAWAADHSATKSGVSWTVSQADGTGLTVANGKQGSVDGASVAKLTQATDNTGKTFTVTYGVGISESQAADTYTGSILYTLANL